MQVLQPLIAVFKADKILIVKPPDEIIQKMYSIERVGFNYMVGDKGI
jgi:hypothetical protein